MTKGKKKKQNAQVLRNPSSRNQLRLGLRLGAYAEPNPRITDQPRRDDRDHFDETEYKGLLEEYCYSGASAEVGAGAWAEGCSNDALQEAKVCPLAPQQSNDPS